MNGDETAIHYAERDLPTVDAAIARLPSQRRRVAVQAGGCLGVFPKYLAKHFDAVYTFEPDPRLFRVMASCATEANVVMTQAALGSEPGLVSTIQERRDGNMLRSQHPGVTHVRAGGRVPVLRLDSFGLQVVDLLVLDLEGYELHALHGSQATIALCRPVVMLEVTDLTKHVGHSPDDVRTFMRLMGYEMVDRVRSDEIYVFRAGKQ